MTFIVELLHADAQPPRRATEGSAGYDLCAYLRGRAIKCSDGPRTWDAAPETGAGADALRAPERRHRAHSARLQGENARWHRGADPAAQRNELQEGSADSERARHDRLGLSRRVDGDRQAIRCRAPIRIEHGERIAQMVLARYEVLEIEPGSVAVSTSRVGGFGSTGR